MSASTDRKSPAKKSHVADIPLVEWVTGAIGLIAVVAVVAVLLYEAVTGDKSPPDVQLGVQGIEALRNGYLVRVRATNEGGKSAARVAITVELRQKTQVIETSEMQFEYLPAHSARDAGVFFTSDPRAGELQLRAHGYEEP